MHAVGRVHPGGVVGQVLARQAQYRVGQVRVVDLAAVEEPPHVVGDDHPQRLDAGELLPEELAMALDAGPDRPRVHAVRADADGPAPPAGAEWQDLVEAVEQDGPLVLADEPVELRPVGGELRVGQPPLQGVNGPVGQGGVVGNRAEGGGGLLEQRHESGSGMEATRCHVPLLYPRIGPGQQLRQLEDFDSERPDVDDDLLEPFLERQLVLGEEGSVFGRVIDVEEKSERFVLVPTTLMGPNPSDDLGDKRQGPETLNEVNLYSQEHLLIDRPPVVVHERQEYLVTSFRPSLARLGRVPGM